MRLGGILRTTDQPKIDNEELIRFIGSIAPTRFRDNVMDRMVAGLDFSYAAGNGMRFRCSAYSQLGNGGIAMRLIKSKIPSIEELNLPHVIHDIALSRPRADAGHRDDRLGQVDHAGGDDEPDQSPPHVEDHHDRRPGGIPAHAEARADRAARSGDGHAELRAGIAAVLAAGSGRGARRRTARHGDAAHRAAGGGYGAPGVFTVHSASAPQTIERIIAMFPPSEHKLLLTQLAGNLNAIISQRLVICHDGSRRPAVEVLRGGPVPTKYILEGRALELGDYIKSAGNGQQTFDQDLLHLHKEGHITVPEALRERDASGAVDDDAARDQLEGDAVVS